MPIKMKVPLVWPGFYADAINQCPHCTKIEQGELAQDLLETAIRTRFASIPNLTYEIDGMDEHHVTVEVQTEREAMLVKLSNGGAK